MNNLAIIPARSGSKGLKDKNIKLLNGKPLIAYSIEAAKKSEIYSHLLVLPIRRKCIRCSVIMGCCKRSIEKISGDGNCI